MRSSHILQLIALTNHFVLFAFRFISSIYYMMFLHCRIYNKEIAAY